METTLVGREQTIIISRHLPTVIIGERINPTGKKRLAEALRVGDMSVVRSEAIRQVEAGARVIDVNVGADKVDEIEVLPQAVRIVAEAVDVPLCVDTAKPPALAAALAVCPGKPLVNSVSGEERSLDSVLPLVRERGAAVIGLCMDEDGIPTVPQKRLEIAWKIVSRAEALHIHREDVIIDPLVLTVGADDGAAQVTLETVRLLIQELGGNITMGASNVSFGLPDRQAVNAAFLAMAIAAGVTCPIVDPIKAQQAILIADLLLGRDEFAMNYISYYRQREKQGEHRSG